MSNPSIVQIFAILVYSYLKILISFSDGQDDEEEVIGKLMLNAHAKEQNIPEVVQVYDQDNPHIIKIKKLIQVMSKFFPEDRIGVHDVLEELNKDV